MDHDHFNSLTPLEDLDDTLLFHYTFPQESITLQDLVSIPNHPAPVSDAGGGSSTAAAGGDHYNALDDDLNNKKKKKKKIVHRDVERQRRQEMANHYSSLRTILPMEYIKGKRSTWEHVDGAVNHIKNMENNIKQLKVKKDKLMILSDSDYEENIIHVSPPPEITVTPCSYGGGIEVIIGGSAVESDRIPLSRVLHVLLEEGGVGVESCVSSKVNGRFYYTLLTEEPTHMTSINLCGLLQQTFAQKLVCEKT